MEKNSTCIYPGTVFTAKNYDPFTKKVLAHPFVCVYDQALDEDLQGETNILALLITSNNKQYSRQVFISKLKNPFLDKDSYCYCNNIYMFLKTDINIIGHLDAETFFDIIKKRQILLRGENDQCVQSLMNMSAYETKVKQRAKEERQREINSANKENHPNNPNEDHFSSQQPHQANRPENQNRNHNNNQHFSNNRPQAQNQGRPQNPNQHQDNRPVQSVNPQANQNQLQVQANKQPDKQRRSGFFTRHFGFRPRNHQETNQGQSNNGQTASGTPSSQNTDERNDNK